MRKQSIESILCAVFICLLGAAPGIAAIAQYTYDNLNRLVQVQYDDGTTIQYAYDAVGNRLTKEVTAFSQASLPTGETSPTGLDGAIPA